MTNLSAAAVTDVELIVMANCLAYEGAVSIIESNCLNVSPEVGVAGWFDVDPGHLDLEAEQSVHDAVLYLEARGLIQRDENEANWVAIHDESEATR